MDNASKTPNKVGHIETALTIHRYSPTLKQWLRTSAKESFTPGDDLSERVAQSKVFATYRQMIKADTTGILKAEKVRLVRITTEILTPDIDPSEVTL